MPQNVTTVMMCFSWFFSYPRSNVPILGCLN